MVFDLPVVDEKVKPHQVTTLHMISALAFIVAGLIIVIYNYTIPAWGAAILCSGILLTILVMAKNKWLISRKVNPLARVIELIISASICWYSFYQKWKFPEIIFGVLSVFLLFAIIWESTAGKPLFVHLDAKGIKFPPTSRRRFRPWTEIEEVILRFGILTVNCVDNTLLQWTVSGNPPDNEIFEAWCIAQVDASRNKRVADW